MLVNDLQDIGNIDEDLLQYELNMNREQRLIECGASVLGNYTIQYLSLQKEIC